MDELEKEAPENKSEAKYYMCSTKQITQKLI